MLTLHKDSHLDHGLSERAIGYILGRFLDAESFFITTFELPKGMGELECALHGPAMGDDPVNVDNAVIWYEQRGTREWKSRMCDRPKRQTRMVTVIAGPHDGMACVLYTVYGGPAAPQEPDDPGCKDKDASIAFWGEHALSK